MSARLFDCPQCGAPVRFASSIAVFAVCEHCRSMVVPRGASVESIGEMAALPPDLSPLQRGTRGTWQGATFELLGRVRVEWAGGSWTEWYAEFSDGRIGWIAETQGFFTVSFPAAASTLPPAEVLTAGAEITLHEKRFTVVDVKLVVCLAGEGELPFVAPPGQTRTSIDLMAGDGAFATVEIFPDEAPQLFFGSYAEFQALALNNLRPVPGWDGDVAQTRHATNALNCPSCGAVVELRAAGQSMSAVCGSCGGVLDTANPQVRLIQDADERVRKIRPILPIGQRGTLFGTEYEVIGLAARADRYAKWHEYLLFNPWIGFRWLVTYNGHWSFVARLLEIPRTTRRACILHDGRTFRLFADENATVTAVLGEFYWKVQRGEKARMRDYVRPPQIASSETYEGLDEVTWSIGEYVDHQVVAKAFTIQYAAKPSGIYLNQPNPHRPRWHSVRWIAAAALAALIAITVFSLPRWSETKIGQYNFEYTRPAAPTGVEASSPPQTRVSPVIELRGMTQPVLVTLDSISDNDWLEVDVDLVNTKTNAKYSTALAVEYYSGVESGEYWSEGGGSASARIPSVPPGTYRLVVDADADPKVAQRSYSLTLKRGGLFFSNFFLTVLLVITYPLWTLMRSSSFETQRWNESDFSGS